MKLVAYFRSLAPKFFHRAQIADEMDEELRAHIALRADDLQRCGCARAQAERQARIEFGGRERIKEECNQALGGNLIEGLMNDVRYALRMLRKSPGFTFTAIVTLALAIGANAVVFAVLNAFLLRPLNVPQAESLYAIERRASFLDPSQSYPDYLDLRDRNRSFDGLAGYTISEAALDAGKGASSVWAVEATGNYFDELRIQPYLGRFFIALTSAAPTAHPTSCSATHTGTAIFRTIMASWDASCN